MICINDNFRLMPDGKIYEGGLVRNQAIIMWFRNNISDYKEVRLTKGRIKNALKVLYTLIKEKNEKIFFFYPTVGIPIVKNGILGRVSRMIFFVIVNKSIKRNQIYFDICDLKYEQSIDLNIDKEREKAFKQCEKYLFRLSAKYNFASESMKIYAQKKYGIADKQVGTLINGGNLYENTKRDLKIDTHKINCVYAGTLNRGRQIEEMIKSFPKSECMHLYLLGVNGEWIRERDNIHYLGKMSEEDAHNFAVQCDLGLIPYDQERLYYNLAYPTKLSFYITAGIPFLGTPVIEIEKIHIKENVGYVYKLEEWGTFLRTVTKEKLLKEKDKIMSIEDNYLWDTVCNENTFLDELKNNTIN